MTTEDAPNKPVHLMYLSAAGVLFFLVKWTVDWVWSVFHRAPSEFAITAGAGVITLVASIAAYRNDKFYTFVNEVSSELKKVTWPTSKEVKGATLVVVIMTIISAAIISLFDAAWQGVTRLIYGG